MRPAARLVGLLAALAVGFLPAPLAAQPVTFEGGTSAVTAADSARDAELDALAAEIGSRLRCLVCRGQSVQESSSQLAREMQALIRQKLKEGQTPEEIEAFFVASYGDFILLKPPAEGLNLLVYVLPALAFVLAGVVLFVWVRRGGRHAQTVPAGGPGSGSASVPAHSRDTAPGGAPTGGGDDGDDDRADSDGPDPLDADDRAWLEAAIRGEER